MLDSVCQALRTCRLRFSDEKSLQEGIERVLIAKKFVVKREHELGDAGTIDFIVFGREGETPLELPIGIEVKIKGSIAEIARQLHRYAYSKEIGAIVLATTQLRHVYSISIGTDLGDKPARMVHMAGSAF